MHLRQLEGVSFVNRRYTKGVPFLSKMVCKRIRGWGVERLVDPLRITLCWVLPWPIGLSLRPAARSCVFFSACYCHILCFLLVFVFNWNASIFLAPESSVRSSAFRSSIKFSRDTSHVSVRPIKTFLHDKPRRKFIPWTQVRGDLSKFVQNLQTSSCFYRSGNHGLT